MNTRNAHQWPLWWRIMILLNISFYNLLGNAFAAGVTPLFGLLFVELHCTPDQAGHLASYALLTLGISNVLALPGSAIISKRYLVLLSQLIFMGCNIWAARATSYNSLLATRIVGGLAGGVIEALGPTFVVETFAEKQLSRAMVLYTSCLALGAGFGPLFSGIIAARMQSWRWFFWILVIVTGVNFVGCIIMLPETSSEFTLEYSPDEHVDVEQVQIENKAQQDDSIATAQKSEIIAEVSTNEVSWLAVWKENSFYVPKQPKRMGNFLLTAWSSIVLLAMPPVTLAVLVYGMSIGWSLVTSVVTSVVFQSPPYLWNSEKMGIYGVAGIVGILLGVPIGGNLSDYLSRWSTRKNGGVHHAESRLPALTLPFIVSPLGVLIIGIYLSKNKIWVGEAIGSAMLSFGTTGAATTMLSYAVDSFPHRSGEIGVLVNVVKNTLGFGLSYAAVEWWHAQGVLSQFGTMAGLLWAVYLAIIPLYFYGERLRSWAAKTMKV